MALSFKQSAPMFLHRADLAPLAKKTEGPSLRGNDMQTPKWLVWLSAIVFSLIITGTILGVVVWAMGRLG